MGIGVAVAGIMIEWAVAELVPALLAEVGADVIRRATTDRAPGARREVSQSGTDHAAHLRIVSDLNVLSATPGRARLSVAGLRGSKLAALEIEDRLLRVPAVTRVHASPITGHVLIEFDPVDTTAEEICASIRPLRHLRTRQPAQAQAAPRLAFVAP